jgi:hypothetical protein
MKGMSDSLMDETFHCKWYCTCSESQNKDLLSLKLLKIHSLQSNFCFTRTGNSGYSLYSSGSWELQAVASTEHGTVKFNPLPYLTLQSAWDLNVPCQPERSKVLLLSYTFKYLLKKMQSFCPCSRALNRSGKGLILCNYITSTIINTNLLHHIYLFLRHILASLFGHRHGAYCSFDVCSLYVNVLGNSFQIRSKL